MLNSNWIVSIPIVYYPQKEGRGGGRLVPRPPLDFISQLWSKFSF